MWRLSLRILLLGYGFDFTYVIPSMSGFVAISGMLVLNSGERYGFILWHGALGVSYGVPRAKNSTICYFSSDDMAKNSVGSEMCR